MADAARPSEVQSPEARLALAQLRALRDSVGYPMAGDAMVLVDEIERLETVIARQAAELDTLREDTAWLRRANEAFEVSFGLNKERGA